MSPERSVLLISDDRAHAQACQAAAAAADDGPLTVEVAQTLSDGTKRLALGGVRVIFLKLAWPDGRGLDTFEHVSSIASGAPIIVLGGSQDAALCASAMRRGATDYLLDGHVDGYAFSYALRHVAERETARRELFLEKERAQVTLNSIGDAVLSIDSQGHVTYLNAVAERLTGWTSKEAVGRPFTEVFRIIDAFTREQALNPMELAIRLDKAVSLTANCLLVRRDGTESAVEDSAAPIYDRDGQVTGAVIVFHDVTGARALAVEMSYLAQHDALTGLPNRALLRDRLSQAVLRARRNRTALAVLYLDLDGFKHVNDTLGHAVGDRLLQAVAARITGCVRSSDTVSRIGGDEFIVLLPELKHSGDAAISATKILHALEMPHAIDDHRLQLGASIGISTYPDGGDDVEMLIANADTAMYQAKEQGRGHHRFFVPDMTTRAAERQSLEARLQHALAHGEFVLHYQPKINLATGAMTSLEALVRWQHPTRGLLLPGEFLPLAEDSGIIVALGRWVLHEACRQTRAWIDAGLPALPVAVNISALEFCEERFLDGVRRALARTGLDPAFLELELTETVLMHRAQSTAATLAALKTIGVRIAIDDFGTGYSSLSYLTRFPVDALKLDQSFVHDVVMSPGDAIVVRAVIDMGKSLKHRIIAEGIETSEQAAFLHTHGCDEGQGYFFGRPMTSRHLAALLGPEASSDAR